MLVYVECYKNFGSHGRTRIFPEVSRYFRQEVPVCPPSVADNDRLFTQYFTFPRIPLRKEIRSSPDPVIIAKSTNFSHYGLVPYVRS